MIEAGHSSENKMDDNADKRVEQRTRDDKQDRGEDDVETHGFHGDASDHGRRCAKNRVSSSRVGIVSALMAIGAQVPVSVETISLAPKTIATPSTT